MAGKGPTKDGPKIANRGAIAVRFLFYGVDYYVAGRYAVFAGLASTAGNLLHHAIEMCLKGALAHQGKSLAELKSLGHDLPKIWNEFKTRYPGHSADAFDLLIRELHEFEEIRYPDAILEEGAAIRFDPGKRPLAPHPTSNVPTYELYLGEIDALMGRLFAIAAFHFRAFTPISATAKKYLYERNEVFRADQ